jgi:hypothetical protein
MVIRFGSCRRAAFEILRGSPGELANRGTLALLGEPPPQLTRHHSRRRSTTKDRPMSNSLTPSAGAGPVLSTFSMVTDTSSALVRAKV